MKSAIAHVCIAISLFVAASPAKAKFAKGFDVGWLSQVEAAGKLFYKETGVQQDCYQLLFIKGIYSFDK